MSDKNVLGGARESPGGVDPAGWVGAPKPEAAKADDRALAPHQPLRRAATVFEPVLAPVWRHFRPVAAKKPFAVYKLVFYLTVVIPTALAALYYGAIATDRYVSVAEMAVRSADDVSNASSGPSSLLSGLLGTTSSAQQSSFILQGYIQSRQVVDTLQERVDLRQLWSVGSADFLSRLRTNATGEDLYDYFQDHVAVAYDPGTGLTNVSVEAFTAAGAQKIAWAIVSLSDELINSIDQKAQQDVVRFAEGEVRRYQRQLENTQLALQDFRNKHHQVNLDTAAVAVGALVAQIDQTLSQDRGQLTAMRQFLKDDAPQVQALKAQIQSLESQLQAKKRRLGMPGDAPNSSAGSTYADALTQYNRLQIEEGFANTAYTAALTELVNAHAAAGQKHLYLVPFVAPSLPQACNRLTLFCDSVEPKRTVAIATVLACGLVGFGILSLLIAAVREHVRL
jgi:capsular polysaccharide transport system permease protein